jgi:hypothetical protein
MRKTTLHAWIAMLICIAAMATQADDGAAPASGTTASAHFGR